MRQDRPTMAGTHWRCVICGRFMMWDAEVADVSLWMPCPVTGEATDPPDPEWAHLECVNGAKVSFPTPQRPVCLPAAKES